MASVKKHGCRRASVSASELAQMGVCERRVVFEHRYGKRRTIEQQQAIKRGRRAHGRFYPEQRRDMARRGRCFIATLMFNLSSLAMVLLRRFRDTVMRSWRLGCRLIRGAARWLRARERRDDP